METSQKYKICICVIISVFACILRCDGACSAKDMIPWDPIRNESAYDMDSNSLNNVNTGRPLGFTHATLEYEDNTDPTTPCVTVTGCADRRVEIMVETDPLAMICIKDETTGSPNAICSEKIYSCVQCPAAGSVTYQFYCDGQSCDQSSVDFWFRFVVSEDPAVLDPEIWCDGRNADQYPSSLIQRVPVPVGPAATEGPVGRSAALSATVPILLLAFIIAWLGQW